MRFLDIRKSDLICQKIDDNRDIKYKVEDSTLETPSKWCSEKFTCDHIGHTLSGKQPVLPGRVLKLPEVSSRSSGS